MRFAKIILLLVAGMMAQGCGDSNERQVKKSKQASSDLMDSLMDGTYRGDKGVVMASVNFTDLYSKSDKPSYLDICLDITGVELRPQKTSCLSRIYVDATPAIPAAIKQMKSKQNPKDFEWKSMQVHLDSALHVSEISGKKFGIYAIAYTYWDKQHLKRTVHYTSDFRGELEHSGQFANVGTYMIIVRENMKLERPVINIIPQQKVDKEKWETFKEVIQERYNVADSSPLMKMKLIAPMKDITAKKNKKSKGKKK